MISQALIDKVKTSKLKQWEIAQKASSRVLKIHPSLLSQIINRLIYVKHNDPRVVAIGRVVNLGRDDCFEAVTKITPGCADTKG